MNLEFLCNLRIFSRLVFLFSLLFWNGLVILGAENNVWSGIGPVGSYVMQVVPDPSSPRILYAAPRSGGVVKSYDGGQSWTPFNQGLTANDVTHLVLDPLNSNLLYAGTYGGSIFYKTTDGGQNWTAPSTNLLASGCLQVTALALDPTNSQNLYLGCSGVANGMVRSTDGGQSWKDSRSGRSSAYVVDQILVDPKNPQNVYAANLEGLLISNNAGQTWTLASRGLPPTRVTRIAMDAFNPQSIYLITFGNVYKSIDGGSNWFSASTGLPSALTVLATDPNQSGLLYAGTSGSQVYRTVNGGQNWVRTGEGLPTSPITALAVHPQNSQNVYAGTGGNGVYSVSFGNINYSEFYFPQIADGDNYTTALVWVSPDTTALVSLESFKPDGTRLELNLNGQTGSTFGLTLPSHGVVNLQTPNLGKLQSGWARVRSPQRIGGSILYRYASGDEAGIDPAVPLESFSLLIDTRNRSFSGLAIANINNQPVDLTFTLYDGDGKQLQQRSWNLPALNQLAKQPDELFTQINTDFVGMLTVEAAGGAVAATTLRYNLDLTAFASLPVNDASPGPATVYFAQIADGGGYKTTIALLNPGNAPLTAELEILQQDGTPWPIRLNGDSGSLRAVPIPAHGVRILESPNTASTAVSGWARIVQRSGPIKGSVIYSYQGKKISEAGISPSYPADRFSLSVNTQNGFFTGLAIANPNNNPVTVSMDLYDHLGQRVSRNSISLGSHKQLAQIEAQLFPDVPAARWQNFTGMVLVQSSGGPLLGTTLRFNLDVSTFASIPVIY